MEPGEIFNLMLGGSLVATLVAVLTLRATVRKARAEAEKATAEAEAMRIDNTEHATRVLMDNIVKPLKDEFNETKRELARNTREMARLRKAIDGANGCDYRGSCPVLNRLRELPKDEEGKDPDGNGADNDGRHVRGAAPNTGGGGAKVGGAAVDTG